MANENVIIVGKWLLGGLLENPLRFTVNLLKLTKIFYLKKTIQFLEMQIGIFFYSGISKERDGIKRCLSFNSENPEVVGSNADDYP